MQTTRILAAVAVFFWASATPGMQGQTPAPKKPRPHAGAASTHIMMPAGDIKWGPAPDALPAGAQVAVLQGDPSKPGLPFVIRAKMPDGYIVPPHWHPTDEAVSVLSGTLLLSMGEKMDESAMQSLGEGSFALMSRKKAHAAKARRETTIQIHGVGPFEITYINPQDDPRKKKATTD